MFRPPIVAIFREVFFQRYIYCIKVKVKFSNYRPGQAQRVPGGRGPQISRQSTYEGGKVVSPTHRPPLPSQEIFLVLIFLEAESTPGS